MLYENFEPGVIAPPRSDSPVIWFAFQAGKLMMFDDGQGASVPPVVVFSELNVDYKATYFLGLYFGQPVYAVHIPDDAILPEPFFLKDLRGLMAAFDETVFLIAGRALQIVQWDVDHQFCSRCGTETTFHDVDRAKECPSCGYTQYPRISPCVIGLVTRGSEVLLARSASFPEGMYSTLAGFVEPGETLEQAFAREVQEEVGVSIKNISYKSSQPWPFPHSLMVGFQAEFADGDIKVDGVEIQEADWFLIDQLPLIPPEGSIARHLIDQYADQCADQWKR